MNFRESPKITNKLRNRTKEKHSAGPSFGTLFCIFLKSSVFPRRPVEGRATRFSSYQERLRRNLLIVRDEGPKRHREDCEYSDMDWCPNGGCTIGIPKREEDLIYGKAVPFHSIG